MSEDLNIAIIGAGAMGASVARGLVTAGYNAALIHISNPHDDKLAPLADLGINTYKDNAQAVKEASLVIPAVKPWLIQSVITEISKSTDITGKDFAPIVASVSCDELSAMFDTDNRPNSLSLVMPNTAVSVNKSMTFIVDIYGTSEAATELFKLLGRVMHIDEKQLGAATSLASCGIAYALRYVHAAIQGGIELSIPARMGQAILAQTLLGASALIDRPDSHPEVEIDRVSTPGGLTIRGLNAMEAHGFTPAVIAGLKASTPK